MKTSHSTHDSATLTRLIKRSRVCFGGGADDDCDADTVDGDHDSTNDVKTRPEDSERKHLSSESRPPTSAVDTTPRKRARNDETARARETSASVSVSPEKSTL
jgi:hypothetical protein